MRRSEARALGYPTLVVDRGQVSLASVPGRPDEAYVFNWIVDEPDRGKGWGRRVWECMIWLADNEGLTLITHPDSDSLGDWLRRFGFRVDADRPYLDDARTKPLMVRPPRLPGEPPKGADRMHLYT
jgi:ribosomal protein S18 acetylase RimI-like enzyme